MPLTAAEWLSENSERQELAVMNIPLAMELYARYMADIEACRFAEWCSLNYIWDHGNTWHNKNMKDINCYTTEQLYSLFKKESNG